ncbi:MAG: hypothetical protein CNIPEHKO_02421 [Anaerolineales bacterium]|nr:hypothetical protein [Anaerolineales bacterium]
MKIIDQTPLIDEKGNLGFSQRIQGMLKFGFNWPTELLAQKAIITYFDRNLEKGYTLIRNQILGQSAIMIPLILIGPAGMFAINIAYVKGRYEAKGESWSVESGNRFKPAPVNLVQSTARMARALTAFIERQGTRVPEPIESVLIAADPGLHVETDKPAVRVLMVDGIKPFVTGLSNTMPVLRSDLALDMVERITNPRPPKQKTNPPQPAPVVAPRQQPAVAAPVAPPPPQENISRARAIFSAAGEEKPINPADFDFALAEDAAAVKAIQQTRGGANSISGTKRSSRRILGMTMKQVVLLGALAFAFVCILAIFGYVIFSMS